LKGAQRREGRARASSGIRRGHPNPFWARCAAVCASRTNNARRGHSHSHSCPLANTRSSWVLGSWFLRRRQHCSLLSAFHACAFISTSIYTHVCVLRMREPSPIGRYIPNSLRMDTRPFDGDCCAATNTGFVQGAGCHEGVHFSTICVPLNTDAGSGADAVLADDASLAAIDDSAYARRLFTEVVASTSSCSDLSIGLNANNDGNMIFLDRHDARRLLQVHQTAVAVCACGWVGEWVRG
jgi:hypothetical protein